MCMKTVIYIPQWSTIKVNTARYGIITSFTYGRDSTTFVQKMLDFGNNLSGPLKVLAGTYFVIYGTSRPPILVPVSSIHTETFNKSLQTIIWSIFVFSSLYSTSYWAQRLFAKWVQWFSPITYSIWQIFSMCF